MAGKALPLATSWLHDKEPIWGRVPKRGHFGHFLVHGPAKIGAVLPKKAPFVAKLGTPSLFLGGDVT